jgi:hypothetical protein
MSANSNELGRVKIKIGQLERSITDLRDGEGESSYTLDNSDQQRILCMLVKTLDALKARRIVLERLSQNDRPPFRLPGDPHRAGFREIGLGGKKRDPCPTRCRINELCGDKSRM